MQYTLTLPTQAFSVNAYRYRKNFAKTADARDYETKILAMLEDHKSLLDLAAAFNENPGSVFRFHINCIYPRHIMLNGHGHLSSKAFDVDNVVKPLIDLVLTEFMGISDRFVIECSSRKSVGIAYAIEISLELEPLEL